MRTGLVLFVLLTGAPLLAWGQQNFFLNDATPKEAVVPSFTQSAKPTEAATVQVRLDFSGNEIPVSKYVYGNNANPYMTQMVDQPVLLDYIKDLSPNVIRFPGGNLSSVYFWNAEKNKPPADAPAKIPDATGNPIDPNYWYGKNPESWTISIDNYYEMLNQTGNTGMITVNYGYARYGLAQDPVAAAAHLAADWVRYDNGKTKYWEIGNESNGNWQAGWRIETDDNKDGQPEIVTGELYGKHFKVFADSMRKAATEKGFQIYIGAQLLQEAPANWWSNTDKNWNSGVFQQAGNLPDFFIIHSYYTPYNTNSNATDILATADKVTKDMMGYVTSSISSAGLKPKPIALTEWNIFATGSKQMISYINGMHAVIVLGELISNKYGMASRWDLMNNYDDGNDHGIFSSGNEPGIPKWNPRPAFYYMYYFQKYFGDTMIPTAVMGSSEVLAYGSSFSSGESSVVLVNKGTTAKVSEVNILSHGVGDRYYYYTLTGGTDNGEFSVKVNVNGTGPSLSAGGPSTYETIKASSSEIAGGIKVNLPPRSVAYVLIDKGDQVVTDVPEVPSRSMDVYPNPAEAKFQILLPFSGLAEIELLDMNGSVVHSERIISMERKIEVAPSLRQGLYILRIANGGKTFIKKVSVK
jgi:hypothetical protein